MDKLVQLGSDVVTLWSKYHDMYLDGIANTLILAVIATAIGCLIGFVCGTVYRKRIAEKKIGTAEGQVVEGTVKNVTDFGAFIADQGAEQCGFCNPGLMMNAIAMFRENPDPTDEEILAYLTGNLCRCSGYEGQLRGIRSYLEFKKAQTDPFPFVPATCIALIFLLG